MSNRYNVRVYKSCQGDGSVGSGTIVQPIDRSLTIFADSAEEAADCIQIKVEKGVLLNGTVYQVCPMVGNPELIRSIAVDADGLIARVLLDPASGLYGELRRVRDLQALSATINESSRPERVEEDSASDLVPPQYSRVAKSGGRRRS